MRKGYVAAYLAAPLAIVAVIVAVSFVRHGTSAAALDPPPSTPADAPSTSLPDVPSTDASDVPPATAAPSTAPPGTVPARVPTAKPTQTTRPRPTGPAHVRVSAASSPVTLDEWAGGALHICVPATLTVTNDGGGTVTQVDVDAKLEATYASGGPPVELTHDPLRTFAVSVYVGHPATKATQLCGWWEGTGGADTVEWKGTARLVGGTVTATVTGAPAPPPTTLAVT